MHPLIRTQLTRRALLRAGLGAAAATIGTGAPVLRREVLAATTACGGIRDIEHVVILIQENRSFDHYFGTHRGVRGFADSAAPALPDGHSVFEQPDTENTADPPHGRLLPFRLNTSTLPPSPNGTCTEDITHAWGAQHSCWNEGHMDGWAKAHRDADGAYGRATMGYYTREDVPFYRAVADAFTICDGYHCSVLGPTDPNRLMAMTGTIDPDGRGGGPVLSNPSSGAFTWTTYPERLEAAGVTWKQYSDRELVLTNSNVLSLFTAYQDKASDLYARGVTPAYPDDFLRDVLGGTLPQVSWLQLNDAVSDHPPDPPALGEEALNEVITILTSNPQVWAKTALFVTWDENGGFFDHVRPPTPPLGTAGEWLTKGGSQPRGPVGLGFRVPMLVVSPFSRGGLVASDTFDHTSTLLFCEQRFGVEVPNLSAWRRSTVGDMTSVFDFATAPDASAPALPATLTRIPAAAAACASSGAPANLAGVNPPAYPVPSPQAMPQQEPGAPRRPSGPCVAAANVGAGSLTPAAGAAGGRQPGSAAALPSTAPGAPAGAALAALAIVAGLVALRRRSGGDVGPMVPSPGLESGRGSPPNGV